MSFGMLALAGMQLTMNRSADLARQRSEAVRLAQLKMEQLRSYDGINSGTYTYGANVVSSGADETICPTCTAPLNSTTNATFARSWAVTRSDGVTATTSDDLQKWIRVAVSWTDRANQTQTVTLSSVIARNDPIAIEGMVGGQARAKTRYPKNRNINVPYPAVTLSGGKTSAFIPSYTYNTVDHPIFPTSGTRQAWNVELNGGPLGGSANFVKQTFEGAWWVPVGQIGRGGPGGGRGRWGPPPGRGWGRRRGPRHATGFVGCLLLSLVLLVGVVTALSTWLAGTLLGILAPGAGASAPTALAVIVVIVLAVLVVGRVFGRAVGPLASVADAAERLADGEPEVRVEVAGPGPVRRLGASFNAMAERLDRSRSDRQALLADVTHELRTPLQVIGGNVEAMLDGVHPRDDAHLESLLAETAVMNRLLDDLRTVSLAEAGALPLHREEVDVRRLLDDVAAGHASAAREAGVELAAGAGPAILLDVDPVRMREVIANLVVNAIRHTPAGGSIRLQASIDGPWVELTVTDTGEGIAPADLDRVFDRFHRRADAGGSGLGLTIARDLVATHGGTIRAESEGLPGRGTTIRVRLPRRD